MHPDRARGQRLLDELATAYDDLPDVDRTRMFGSEGLRVVPRGVAGPTARGRARQAPSTAPKVFAFVGREGQLIVKLPAPRVAELLAAGEAEPVHVGRNPTREWASIPYPADPAHWRDLLAEAHAFVSTTDDPPQGDPTHQSR
jgi:hypothetical protein